jgi:hypothetical protein
VWCLFQRAQFLREFRQVLEQVNKVLYAPKRSGILRWPKLFAGVFFLTFLRLTTCLTAILLAAALTSLIICCRSVPTDVFPISFAAFRLACLPSMYRRPSIREIRDQSWLRCRS